MADIANPVPLSPMEMQVQQQAIDRQRKIAEFLQQQSLTQDQGQMVSGHYVAPSATQYLAKLAQGLLGRSQQDSLDQKQMGLATQQGDALRGQFGIGNQPNTTPGISTAPQQDTPSIANSTTTLQTTDGGQDTFRTPGPFNVEPGMAKVAQALQTPGQSGAQSTGAPTPASYGSRVLNGMNPLMAFQLYNSDPKTYDAAYLKQYEPTELQRNDKYLGVSADQSRALEIAKRAASGAITNKGFGVLIPDPITGKLINDPASMAGIEQAKAIEGKFGAPVNIRTTTGKEVQLSPTEWADYQKSGNLPLRMLPAEQRQAIQNDANKSGASASVSIQTDKGLVGGRIAPEGLGQIGVSQSPAQKAEQEELGKNLAVYQKEIDEKANAAQVVKSRISEMRDASQGFTGGALTPYKEQFGGIMSALGANPDTITSTLGNISDMQSFNKEALATAFDMTKQLTSRPAASEVLLALKANPGLALQPDASRKIMNVMEGMADYTLAKQQGSVEWRKSHDNSIDGFEAAWNQSQPIKKYIDFVALKAPIPKGGTQPNQTSNRPSLDSLIKVR